MRVGEIQETFEGLPVCCTVGQSPLDLLSELRIVATFQADGLERQKLAVL